MNAKLTYVVFLSFIACLVSSCTSDTPDVVNTDNGRELSFIASGMSRASVISDINTPGSKFAVFGDMKFSGTADASPSIVFNKTEVAYIDNEWYYDDTQYWYPKHEYSFVAVFPLSVVGSETLPRYSDSSLSFTYTISASSGNEVNKNDIPDILGATHRRSYTDGASQPVSLRFSHLMSLINILPGFNDNIMDSETYIKFHKVELTGVKNKATFNILPAPILSNTQTDDRVIEMTGQDGEINLTIAFPEPKKIMNHGDNVRLFDANDAIIMLPQIFAADSGAKIVLTYTINDDPEAMTLSVPLRLREWEPGKSYNYKFTLDRTGLVSSTTTITDWEVMDVGNIDAN